MDRQRINANVLQCSFKSVVKSGLRKWGTVFTSKLNYRYYYNEFVINLENVQSRRFGSFLLPEADIYAIREKLNENIK